MKLCDETSHGSPKISADRKNYSPFVKMLPVSDRHLLLIGSTPLTIFKF
jgi:hypothetical protein